MEWLRTPLVDERAAAAAAAAADAESQLQSKAAGRPRLMQLDLLRGCIMVVMAWGQSTDRQARGGTEDGRTSDEHGPGRARASALM